jgi:murein DD-endopeptidase MepM/ murein hydrolase activator NlpD
MATSSMEEPPEVEVPFACGLSFPVSQAHDTGSHRYYDTWAWDFRMPVGTPVVAARAGVVRLARGDSTVGGCDMKFAPYSNYVVLEHAGGLETQYLHFERVVVQPGQRVEPGELLGYSGATGWACGAHLHFKVAKRHNNGWNNPSLPARIAGYGDPQRGAVVVARACPEKRDVPLMAQSEGADKAATPPGQQTAHAHASRVEHEVATPEEGRVVEASNTQPAPPIAPAPAVLPAGLTPR